MAKRKLEKPDSSNLSPGAGKVREFVAFCGLFTIGSGLLAGQPVRLAEWQLRDIGAPLFGTVSPAGLRLYRTCFVEIARKNGKSFLAALIALWMLFMDDEPSAQVILAAADKSQASEVVFKTAVALIEGCPQVREAFTPHIYRDAIEWKNGVLRVVSADAPGKHGLNPSAVIIDEVHAIGSRRDYYDALTTGQGARVQPLKFLMTTAGTDRASIAYQLHRYAGELRAGLRSDPSFLSVFYGSPEGDDWTDRRTWHKANPALSGPDAFLSLEHLEDEFRMAAAMPAREATFQQLYLNRWMTNEHRWLDISKWDASAGHVTTEAETTGRVAYGGLDVAVINDVMVIAWVLPCVTDPSAFDVFVRAYLPAGTLVSHHNAALYEEFRRDGYLTVIPGDVIDHRVVEADILQDATRMQVRAVNIDARFQGVQLLRSLQEHGLTVLEMPQTHASFAESMRESERLVHAGKLHHGGNPVLRWMAENCLVKVDGNGDMRPDRARSRDKIDGIVASVMAIDAAIRVAPPPPEPECSLFIF